MTIAYTDAQLQEALNVIANIREVRGDIPWWTVERLVDRIEALLTERQAGSSGDVETHAWMHWRTDESTGERDYDIYNFHSDECGDCFPVLIVRAEPSVQPPQPPTKESVRGVGDEYINAVKSALNANLPDEHKLIYGEVRAALESFANRGDGDE